MATHKSAEKRHRQSLKRKANNHSQKAAFRTAVRKVQTLISAKAPEAEVKEAVRSASSLLDKAAVHGVIHKKTAQRKISRISSRAVGYSA